MTQAPFALRILVVALLALGITGACSGKESVTGPSPNPPPLATPPPTPPPTPPSTTTSWSNLPPLSAEAKDFIVNYNLNMNFAPGGTVGAVKMWSKSPISIYATPDFRPQDLVAAVDFVENLAEGKIRFQIVDNPPVTGIVMDMQWPPPGITAPISDNSCGAEGPRLLQNNVILLGIGNYAFKAKSQCVGNGDNRIGLAHGILHILGLGGHTPSGTDVLSSPAAVWKVSPLLSEIVNWLAVVAPGTRPV